MSSSPERQIADLKPGEHVGSIYQDRDELSALCTEFVKAGLAGDCRCVYVADDQTVPEVHDALVAAGVNVGAEQEGGALRLLTKRDTYLRDDEFSPTAMIEFLRREERLSLEGGFSGLWCCGEMTWALGRERGTDRLIEYESLLDQMAELRRSVVLCLYNEALFGRPFVHEVLRLHTGGVLGTSVAGPARAVETGSDREELYRILMENTHDAVSLTDLDGRRVYVSPSARRLLGWLPESPFEGVHADDLPAVRRAWECARAGEKVVLTFRHALADGSWRWLESSRSLLRFRGKPHILAVTRDVTERKQAEDALREREELLRLLTENTGEFIRFFDPAGRTVYANAAVERLLGAVPDDLGEFAYPEDRERIRRWFERLLTGAAGPLQWRVLTRGGEWRWLESRGTVVQYRGRSHVLMICRDATERRQAEENLRRSEEQLRLVIDAIPVMAWTLRPDGVVDFLNRRWIDYSGISLEQYAADPTGPIHPDDVSRAIDNWRVKMAAGDDYDDEMRLRRADGEYRWFLVRTATVRDEQGHVIKWYGVSTDIEDRKRAEEQVRESRELLQSVLATLPVGVAVTNMAGDVVLVNEASKRIWGEIIVSGHERWERSKGFWHASGKTVEPEEWASLRALREGQTTLNELLDIETFDGRKKTIQNSAAPVRNAEGAILAAVIVNEDVTKRVRAEAALRESEHKLNEAQRLAHIGYWERDLGTGHVAFSEETARIFGRPGLAAASMEELQALIHPDDRQLQSRALAEALAGTRSYELGYRIVRPDGEVCHIHVRDGMVLDEGGRTLRMFGTVQDVTERVRSEVALREYSDRLHHLSRRLLEVQEEERRHLARELHDEFGQLLATITVQLHAAKTVDSDAARSILDECISIVQRAGDRVRSLALELRPTMLDTAGLDESLRWLAAQHQQRTGVATALVGHVHDVPSEVATTSFRVAQEALTNAVKHAKAQHVWIEVTRTETDLELAVCDDGVGFDVRRTMEHAASSGRLGLIGMRERVEILGGHLEVDAEPGRGTQVRISLPLAESAASGSIDPTT